MTLNQETIRRALRRQADTEKAATLARFFKTGKGEYAEGDRFLGITVPAIRSIVRRHEDLSLPEALELLQSSYHEERLAALLFLVEQYRRGTPKERTAIYRTYLAHTAYVNNWDLVDLTASRVVGAHLAGTDIRPLERLAASRNLWERRIAMVATFFFTCHGDPAPALHIAEKLVYDDHDLIQKAVGWMLREVGKRCSIDAERAFLDRYAATMPRTALRYAIERMDARERTYYMTRKDHV